MADNEDDSLKNESSSDQKGTHGGKRDGAGRKEGSMNKATAASKAARKRFIDRVNANADKLFNSQLDLAVGEKYLMVTKTIGKGARARRETSIVTSPSTIQQYLDDPTSLDDENEYYFMTTKAANNMAIDSLLNRSFGKATEKIDLSNEDGSLNPYARLSVEELKKLANS